MASTGRHKTDRPALSAREVRFCRHYAEHGIGYQAYLAAGFPGKATRLATDQAVFRLVRNRKIRQAIRLFQDAATDAALVSVERLAQLLARILFADRSELLDDRGRVRPRREWPADLRAAVEGVEVEEEFRPVPGVKGRKELKGVKVKVRMANKVAAARLLAELSGYLKAPDAGSQAHPPLTIVGDSEAKDV